MFQSAPWGWGVHAPPNTQPPLYTKPGRMKQSPEQVVSAGSWFNCDRRRSSPQVFSLTALLPRWAIIALLQGLQETRWNGAEQFAWPMLWELWTAIGRPWDRWVLWDWRGRWWVASSARLFSLQGHEIEERCVHPENVRLERSANAKMSCKHHKNLEII